MTVISLSAVVAHLWQSTLFAAAIALATLALRRNRAAVRHALWLAASLKFLVPFTALTALGAQFGPLGRVVERTEVAIVIKNAGPEAMLFLMPAAPPVATHPPSAAPFVVAGVIWICGVALVGAVWAIRWRRVAAIAGRAAPMAAGREVDALRRVERAAGLTTPIRLVGSDSNIEPGIFGLVRPRLIWPRAIADRFDEQQLVAILAHEVAHVRRRDNLAAALHMAVEAIFWFHPLVWWIGARLVDERERACDEAVVRLGHEPRVYAETILQACRLFLESPLACVSGVTGSDLRARIERIMQGGAESLTLLKKLLVAAVPMAAIVAPVVFGVINAPRVRAASPLGGQDSRVEFEVVSVKANKSSIGKIGFQTSPGGRFNAVNVTLRQLIRFAYQLQDSQLSGGPKWLDDDRFDIVAKAEGGDLGEPFLAERTGQASRGQLMLRSVLADRFKLQVHTESREQAVYALVMSRRDGALGPQLQRSTADCSVAADARQPAPPPGARPQCGIRILPGNMAGGGAGLTQLANSLAAMVGRLVIDRTGLTGAFDFTVTWTPDQSMSQGFDKKTAGMGLPPIDPNGPSIFTALQEQLGLKLDAQKGPVDVVIVDRAEHPVEN